MDKRNISKTNGKYIIRKSINKKRTYYGTYDTLEEAIEVRNKLKQNNWNKNCLPYKLKKLKGKNRYIVKSKTKGKYVIIKKINSKQIYFGLFKTIEEARKERDLLEQNNWDFETLCSLM